MSHLFTDLHASLGASFFVPVSAAKPPSSHLALPQSRGGAINQAETGCLMRLGYLILRISRHLMVPFLSLWRWPIMGINLASITRILGMGAAFFAQIKQAGTGRL